MEKMGVQERAWEVKTCLSPSEKVQLTPTVELRCWSK